ncbi:unnamed protein product [Heterobilharzia americana]|nr:unnamed protein product [Heterobilharzia americana]
MVLQPVVSPSNQMLYQSNNLSSMINYENNLSLQTSLLNAIAFADRHHEQLPFILTNFLNQPYSSQLQGEQTSSSSSSSSSTSTSLFHNILTNHDIHMNNPIDISSNITTPIVTNPSNNLLENSNLSFPNFLLTTSLTKAISSNLDSLGGQLLPICAPLLQLAIRQAVNQCFPTSVNLHIKGRLDISTNNNHTQQNESNLSNTTNSSQLIVVDNDIISTCYKQLNPSQYYHSSDIVHIEQPYINNLSSPLLSTSCLTSPSSDSGILDLSRNGSLAGSAPITPMKDLNLSTFNSNNTNNSNNSTVIDNSYELQYPTCEQDIFESYKKQLAAFHQIQAVWKMSTSYNIGDNNNNNNNNYTTDNHNNNTHNDINECKSNQSEINNSHSGKMNRRSIRSIIINPTNRLTGITNIRRTNSNRRFPCNQCKQEFPSLHTLEQHTLCQHGTYRCHICKAQFTQRSNLQRHALKHVGFKPFECRVCSKAYYRKDHLMRHMEMGHPGYTPRDNITVHLTSSESLDYLNRALPNDSNQSTNNSNNNNTNSEDDDHDDNIDDRNHFNTTNCEFSSSNNNLSMSQES